ncbi:MAG TPA: sigma-54-dependent Fis family transcriptional regulator [Flavobacteriales bacterium]|nr:sigma-54-dependent Fis family transcriptional regulator [Flavobacteriales bacterium]|tara:strand:+ start:1252 stop:2496 length:1245 start_codon:yes stop_codon:yes gene_type:complete
MELQSIKQRFGIIGNSPALNRAIDVAYQVASTNITVLINGESGTGKEVMPKIIHQLSTRKHGPYIAVNCGAIPEGTIDSELFGHEKGSFTGATGSRKGYFEEADGGTIFLDEVAELPLQTQVRLLRVLETGEFLKVGSSKVIKTDVRVVAATNVNFSEAISRGKFREDLFYRLSTVPIIIPPLRDRKEDIHLLFRKFTTDFADKYGIPILELTPDAVSLLESYSWPGNIRQLKNITEQISVIEKEREINSTNLRQYLPEHGFSMKPMVIDQDKKSQSDFSEREILYKVLFDMKKDMNDVKQLVMRVIKSEGEFTQNEENSELIRKVFDEDYHDENEPRKDSMLVPSKSSSFSRTSEKKEPTTIHVEETLSLAETEKELIRKALKKHNNKRKHAARELGISERTLYRKINEYDLK